MNPILAAIGGTIVLAIFAIAFGLILSGIDRRVVARMQARIGPPLLQPLTDVRKLLAKQNIIPANAIPWLFNAMPVVALASAIAMVISSIWRSIVAICRSLDKGIRSNWLWPMMIAS